MYGTTDDSSLVFIHHLTDIDNIKGNNAKLVACSLLSGIIMMSNNSALLGLLSLISSDIILAHFHLLGQTQSKLPA
jgi:hypothetical protein